MVGERARAKARELNMRQLRMESSDTEDAIEVIRTEGVWGHNFNYYD
jgi:hypothetical protein